MKKLMTIVLLMLLGNAAIAQAPQGVSYQAVARNSAGAILASQPVALRFSVRNATPSGAVLYQETFNVTTTPLGLFNVNVGAGTVTSGSFAAINWAGGTKYLQVEMDATGGTSYATMGTAQQMMSVPYSLYSNNGVPNGTTTGDMLYWTGTNWAGIPAGSPGQVLTVNGSGIPAWSGELLPAVTSAALGSITGTSATGGGNVSSGGGSAVTARGVCWSTTSGAASISGAHTSDGSGTGSFTSAITGLSLATTYYVRAYASNSMGTSYGSEVSFTTEGLPTLTTTAISSITISSATGGGNVLTTGGATVTAYGVCWSTTSGAESASGAHTTDGSGTGSFTSGISGLMASTTYYVKAYAVTSVGTAYGSEVSFTTSAIVVPTLTTASAGSITSSGAASGGSVTATGGASVTAYGVCWSTTSGAESISGSHTTDGSGTGSFTSSITGLAPGTTYYVMAYATNSAGTAYGSEISFTTNAVVPTLTTASASSITSSGAASGGNITASGGASVTAYGVCWSTTSGAESISGSHTTDGSGTGSFASSITGLAPGTTYYVMAYATNSAGTAYGSEISFTTNAVVPTLTTTSAGSITGSGATSGGNVTASGGASVTAYGVCWSTTSGAESISGSHTTDGSGTGSFTSSITGLAPGTTYYVMAYATNSAGTAYGSEVSFTTNAVVPTLTTASAGSITSSGAVSGGNVTASGGATVTAYGVCWSTTSGVESISGSHTTDGSGTGSFTSSITGLAPGTTYYVMAYATNSAGTAYGSEVSFTTSAVVPTLTTASASSITSSGAVSGGNVTASGGASVTVYGVCWSTTSGAESISGSHTTDGSGTGSFTSSITGLAPGTTYYVMAYATNSAGTAYGSEISFTTAITTVPTLTTASASSITSSSAISGGNISSDGGSAVTVYGVCWSTTSGGESVSGAHTTDGSGTGSFTSNITGLSAGTTYYVMAYATNTVGTAYGSEISFTTTASLLPTVITSSITGITSSSFTGGGTVTSSGGAPVTARGIVGGLTPGVTLATGHIIPVGSGLGSFDTTVGVGAASTTIYVTAYATNSYGTAYGSEVSFTTLPPTLPGVVTGTIGTVTATSAIVGGTVTATGGASVTYGACWSTTSGAESVSGAHSTDGSGGGGSGSISYTSNISGLIPGTTYYVMSYATNSVGTVYGSEVSFTTSAIVVPTLTTASASSITSTGAASGGNITASGGASVTAYGVCWSTTSGAESISGSYATTGYGIGSFTSSIIGLSVSTTYYVRAFATNSAGTAYGNEISFTTAGPALPTVVGDGSPYPDGPTAEFVTYSVTSDGGATVTARGLAWSTTPGGESISSAHSIDGSGIGYFTGNATGLTTGTTYYVKAYATNSVGTAYGSELSFTTPSLPTVTTTGVLSSGIGFVNVGGNVTTVCSYAGICWSTTSGGESVFGPSTYVTLSGGTGSFSSSVSGLTSGVTYYLKAYASNSWGTAYGTEISFTAP